MKTRLLVQTAVVVSVVLLCTGIGVYSYLRLNSVENRQDFNLYTLVPQDAIAVLETDRVADLVDEINGLNCSKDNRFLYASDLFVCLKNYLYTLVDDTPHGLSKQMNKVLLSFHEPDTPVNQVLYCSLGTGDIDLVESFVQKYSSTSYTPKESKYKGEKIRIYPMADGRFLATYFTSDFVVLSFQKRLVEQVIDVRQSKKSLLKLPAFKAMHEKKHTNVTATAYVRMKAVDMGKSTDEDRTRMRLGNWVEFDMKFNENAVYCSGISHDTDSIQNFINVLQTQEPIEGFSGECLPQSAFFHCRWAISEKDSLLEFARRQVYDEQAYPAETRRHDEALSAYLAECADTGGTACIFRSRDTLDVLPCAVICIPTKDAPVAEVRLQSVIEKARGSEVGLQLPSTAFNYSLYPRAQRYRKYALPPNTLLTQTAGIKEPVLDTYACFYRGNLLLAPDVRSLSAYIESLEKGEVLDGTPLYEEVIGSLSPVYNFMMMADMEVMLNQPEAYVHLMPNFFFRHARFFCHFVLAVQFTCMDGAVFPNIVLLYKG